MENPFDLSLSLSSFSKEERMFIAEQIECRKKAKIKLPHFYKHKCIFTKRSLEQSTSENVAKYKSDIFQGNLLLDLCGGLGVDDYWLSQSFKKVISLDSNFNLNNIVSHNNTLLKVSNHERLNLPAEEYDYSSIPNDTTIYIDPDRRDNHGNRQFIPSLHTPNIFEILEKISEKVKVILKLSPMVDLTLIRKQIPNISGIWVISTNLENKEILIEINGKEKIGLHAVEIDKESNAHTLKMDLEIHDIPINSDLPYLIIPSASVQKAKMGNSFANKFGLAKINKAYQFLFSSSILKTPHGRTLQILKQIPYKPKTIAKELKELKIEKAELISRDFFHKTEELSKKLKIKKGGSHLLVFTKDIHEKGQVIICLLKNG